MKEVSIVTLHREGFLCIRGNIEEIRKAFVVGIDKLVIAAVLKSQNGGGWGDKMIEGKCGYFCIHY